MTDMLQKSENVANENSQDLIEKWINIYKSKKYGDSYWTGVFGHKTKEDAIEDLADKENYLTTINIEEVLKLQEQNAQLKELLKEVYVAINEGSYFDQCDILKKIDEALK